MRARRRMGARRIEPERLDEERADPADLEASLEHVARVNRWLGGLRSLRRALKPYRDAAAGDALRILDVGTGNAELPVELLEWAAARGRDWRGVGIDRHPTIVPIAARRLRLSRVRFGVVRGDALRLPFGDASFDVALCTLTLHHFPDGPATSLLREMARVARRAVIVSDLERTALALAGAHLLAATWWRRNPITRHDGPTSVRAAFTRDELGRLGAAAGLRAVRVRRHFPFRLLLEGQPPRTGIS